MTASPKPPEPSDQVAPLEAWAGVECSRIRVGRRIVDQLSLTGHDRRAIDLDLIGSLGVKAVRYPVLWERVAPRGLARADWRWSDRRLARLRTLGIRPIVGLLHHGYGPMGMSLLHPGFPMAFARYAQAVARRYPWIDEYVPINEPLTTARFSGLYGFWYPHARSEEMAARLLLAQCLAIRAASRAIRAVNPSARIIVNEDVGRTFSTPALAHDADYLNERRWLTWDILFGRATPGHPMYPMLSSTRHNERMLADLTADPSPPETLGVDHYVTSDRFLDHRVAMYPASRRNPDAPGYVDIEACRVRGVPAGSIDRALRDAWSRYGWPMALSEIALAGEAKDQAEWWTEAWRAATAARSRGVEIRSVTAWAVFGGVDWHCLMTRPENVYAPGVFDVSTRPASARPVADAIRSSARGPAKAHTVELGHGVANGLRTRGWWLRPDRFSLTT